MLVFKDILGHEQIKEHLKMQWKQARSLMRIYSAAKREWGENPLQMPLH